MTAATSPTTIGLASLDGRCDPLRVAVLAGGPDAERSISLETGRSIADALRQVDAALCDRVRRLDRSRLRWPHVGHPPLDLQPLVGGFAAAYAVGFHEIDRLTAADLGSLEADLILPALHGPWGEGGPLQRLLEEDGRPFVGCGSTAAAVCMDKWRTKEVSRRIGVATPEAEVVRPVSVAGSTGRDPGAVIESFPVPAVVKPIDDGSSVGIRICRDRSALAAALQEGLAGGRPLLVERYIAGRELTVGIVAEEVNSIIEIVPEGGFFDFEAKYISDRTQFIVDPVLPPGSAEAMADAALRLYRACGCRDLGRVDFRMDEDGAAWMLEINTFPGFTSHSLVPLGARASGLSLPALCCVLVEHAWARAKAPVAGAGSISG